MSTMKRTSDVEVGDVLVVHQNGCDPDYPCQCEPWHLTVESRHRPTHGIAAFRNADGQEAVAAFDGLVEVL